MNQEARRLFILAAALTLAAATASSAELETRSAIAGPAIPQAIAGEQLRPLSLASADFDSDGVPDLAAGFALPDGRGVVVLYRGNLDALYPHSPEARQRRIDGRFVGNPFLPTERVLTLSAPPDFLQAGDFDADGNADLAAGTSGGAELQLLSGNGTGLFREPRTTPLPGLLTALAAGDIGARDGLADLVASVTGAAGSRAVILQSASGAFSGAAASIALPAAAASIAVGTFADSSRGRVALLGEDGRVYFLDKESRRAWKRGDAETREELDAATEALAPRRAEAVPADAAAMISMRVGANAPSADVVLSADGSISIFAPAVAGTFVVDVSTDLADAAPGNGLCEDVNGDCSLRAAIQEANATPAADIISFAIPGAGIPSITTPALPALTAPVTIDGTTQAAGRVEITGTTNGTLLTFSADGCVLRGIVLNGTGNFGLRILSSGNVVEGNYFGTTPDGSALEGGIFGPNILVVSGTGTRIGGTVAAARNVISGSSQGIRLDGGSGTLIQGNYIGTDATGTVDLGPNGPGIRTLTAAVDGTIGGAAPGAGNVISGNSTGIQLDTAGFLIQGNIIGLDANGALALPNTGPGIDLNFNGDTAIGGTAPGMGNVISGNGSHGIELAQNAPHDIVVQGNRIGTDYQGFFAIPNQGYGIHIFAASETRIGGPAAGAGNLISGNLLGGIFLTKFSTVFPTDNVIQGNLIGTDITGTVPVGNVGSGVIFEWALGTLVGGAGFGEGNTISGNQEHGVRMGGITDASANPNRVLGNNIGANVYGTGALGNGQAGVYFHSAVPGYELGGAAPGEMNRIAFNGGPGVGSGTNTSIHFGLNTAYSNGGLGVDRGSNGPTPNAPPGTFVWENAPILTSAATSPAGTSVSGTLASGYAVTFTIHVFANPSCDPSGYGEARQYLGAISVPATAGAATPFSGNLPATAPAGSYITALSVAPAASPYLGATSELSFCRQVTGDPGPPDPVALSLFVVSPAQGGNAGSVSLTVTGEGIAGGAAVKLTRSGEPDIPGEFVHVGEDGGNVRAIFNLGGAAPGLWDVVVTNPDTSTAALAGAFTIEASGRHDVWVDIIGRSRILRGRETKFYVIYGNRGNVDAFFVPVWVTGIPLDATIDLKFNFIPQPQLPGLPPTDYASIPPILDTPSDRRVPLLIPIVPAGQTRVLLITIKTQQPTFDLAAAIGEPWMQPVAGLRLSAPGGLEVTQDFVGDLTECLATLFKTVFTEILDQLLPLDCVDLVGNVLASQLPNFFGNMLDASQASAGSDMEAFALMQSGTQVAQIAVTGAKCLADVGGAAFPPLLLAKAALDVLSEIEKYTEVILKCGPLIRDFVKLVIETVVPSDPNDKIGSLGTAAEHWVSGLEPARYEILFENKPQATAPAHEVVITDQLDLTRFDVSTFAFGPVSFGDFSVNQPAPVGATEFTKDVDMRPTRNVIVRLSGGLDAVTGLLTWHFHSLDPATLLPSEDPDQGFLPPNVNAPEGEGTTSFVVALQDGLSSGTEYRNRATIIFDLEAPIETPEWLNTIDVTPPTSQVSPLPATSCSAIPLLWSGSDAHSGIRGYDISFSEDGGPWTLWLAHRPGTSATFVGQAGHTYAFYSVARDAADNAEAPPASADASTNAANPSPVVDLLEPTSGSAAGASVDLTGNGFLAGLSLTVGGAPATGVTVTDPQTASAAFPGLAPGALHDVTATNTGGCGWTSPKAWFADFLDVDQLHPFHRFVENIFRKGITAGCASAGNYCPANPVTRAQMAVFLLKSKYGASYTPPAAAGVFGDVPPSNPFAPWIEQLATELITAGCSGGNYCPANAVTRAQMAVFLLKSKYGPNLVPPPATGIFADVPVSSPFAPWIEMLAEEEITGGCGGPNYCPNNPVTRGQMAVFLTKTFGYVQ